MGHTTVSSIREGIGMSNKTVEYKSSGIGFFGLLTILFIGLKLTGYIEWGWLWVLSPLWIPMACVAGLIVIVLFCMMVAGAIELVISRGKE